jgi:homoserine dehydrogenase
MPSPVTAATRTRALGRVGLLGCGTVGSGVARRLIASHPGLIKAIAVRDPRKPRDVAWDDFGGDPFEVVDDPQVRVVVECIGGLGLARELVLRAIARGKDVVTANKDLIATEGPWLAAFAARTGASLRYDGAVGGAIHIEGSHHENIALGDSRRRTARIRRDAPRRRRQDRQRAHGKERIRRCQELEARNLSQDYGERPAQAF